jgi:large subunit ribosomal protein L14e
MGLFRNFVEIGRVVYINYGPYQGHVAVVVDVINGTRLLVDGPTTGVPRHSLPLRRCYAN